MRIEKLTIENFRLIRGARLELAPGANLFTGRNAQGKTTVLEAAGLLATGRSFRTPRERECVAMDAEGNRAPHAAASCRFVRNEGRHELRAALTAVSKSIWLDGKFVRRLGELWGQLAVVVFVPSDLDLVRGAPSRRRALLDTLIAQTSPADLRSMQAWEAALRQRNALLREPRFDARAAESFEAEMARHGAALLLARARLLEALRGPLRESHALLSGGADSIEARHETGLTEAGAVDLGAGHEAVAEALARGWAADRAQDRDRGHTRHGPHRGDVAFYIDGQDARAYASQGQARSIVLAARLAEIDVLEGALGEPPILLLDDVLGELDRERAGRFVKMIARRKLQALLTATDAALIEAELPIGARFTVEGGVVAG